MIISRKKRKALERVNRLAKEKGLDEVVVWKGSIWYASLSYQGKKFDLVSSRDFFHMLSWVEEIIKCRVKKPLLYLAVGPPLAVLVEEMLVCMKSIILVVAQSPCGIKIPL